MVYNARTSWTLWAVVTAAAWWHLNSGLVGMPEYMATHFGGGGQPNGWMSPRFYARFMAAMWGVMTLSFWGLRGLFRVIPSRWFNLPNREYWLAPERREVGIARMSAWLEAYGLVTLIGIIGLNELVFAANRMAEPALTGGFGWGLAAYLGGTVVWIVAFYRAFRIPE